MSDTQNTGGCFGFFESMLALLFVLMWIALGTMADFEERISRIERLNKLPACTHGGFVDLKTTCKLPGEK